MRYVTLAISFCLFLLPQAASARVYYVDFSTTTSGGDGLTLAAAFGSINAFANNARAAGDIAYVRRGFSSTTNQTSVTITSDGTLNNPITIMADFDNLWGDFATSSQTFSPTFGQKYIATSASTTDAFPRKWIYFAGDCYEAPGTAAAQTSTTTCDYAYEIATASSTGISLYFPYTGGQAGSGKTGRLMPFSPTIGTDAGANQVFAIGQDDYWRIIGIEGRSTNASCVFQQATSRGSYWKYITARGNGTTDCGFNNFKPPADYFEKIRTFGMVSFHGTMIGVGLRDAFIDCNNVGSSNFMPDPATSAYISLINVEVTRCTNFLVEGVDNLGILTARNVKHNTTYSALSGSSLYRGYFEDDFGIAGFSQQISNQISAATAATTSIATTTNLRSGGGPSNALFLPPSGTANTGLSVNNFPHSYMKLFEYPIYTDTSSKTYTMYLNSTSTSNFSINPTSAELWLECEYYGSSVTANRSIKKSTSVVDFAGSTAWQSISVTCAPSQSGILYLRAWYGKPKDTKSNWFYLDLTPVVS